MLKEMTIKDFMNDLASDMPAPGGGGAAAMSAALASALTSMVFNLTIGKKVYNEYSEEIQLKIKDELHIVNVAREEFLAFMDKDATAFLSVIEAFKLSKTTEEEKTFRSGKIQAGYKEALEVPLELAKSSFKIYDYIITAVEYGNINVLSDAGVAAMLLQTAIESAILNVEVNLSNVKDEQYISLIKDQCNNILSEGNIKKKRVVDMVYKSINK